MSRVPLSLATAAALLVCLPAFAGTLRCTRVNGNLNCAGSGGVSCQTVNGRTICTNGDQTVVQSFGGPSADDQTMGGMDDDDMGDDIDSMLAPRHPRASGH